MMNQIETSDDSKITPDFLIKLRLDHKLPVPNIVIEYEDERELVDSPNDIEKYEFVEEDELQLETETDPMIPMIEEDFFEAENFLFEFPNDSMTDTTMIEQSSSSQIFNKTIVRRFQCGQCSKLFKEERQLHIHKQTHLPNDLKFVHQCPQCDKKFSSTFSVRNHIKHVHIKATEFRCEYCNKDFSRKANYDSHLSHVHTRDRKFECEICGLKVKTKGILRTHKLLHSDNPADIKRCPHCPKMFKTQNQLLNHIRRHPPLKIQKLKS